MNKIRLAIMLVVLILFGCDVFGGIGYVKAFIVDEVDGEPIRGAKVYGYFHNYIVGVGGISPTKVKGYIYGIGRYFVLGYGNGNSMTIEVKKEGYYTHTAGVEFERLLGVDLISGASLGFWRPWGSEVVIKMRRKVKPHPMYVKNILNMWLPTNGVPVGYDLMKGDFVKPYGSGVVSDLIFQLNGTNERIEKVKTYEGVVEIKTYDWSLIINFSNDGDGVVGIVAPYLEGSALRIPAVAPADGYRPRIMKRNGMGGDANYVDGERYSNMSYEQNYYIRVRTRKDREGRIVSAYYGKVENDFWLLNPQDGGCYLSFLYYLNGEANERNVEYDGTNNLIEGINYRDKWSAP